MKTLFFVNYVADKPIVQISPIPSITVNETDNATLKCEAFGGNPAVYSYKWQHNGQDISGGENGILELINVKRNQRGSYSCLGCNLIGCTRNTSTIIVQCKHILT